MTERRKWTPRDWYDNEPDIIRQMPGEDRRPFFGPWPTPAQWEAIHRDAPPERLKESPWDPMEADRWL